MNGDPAEISDAAAAAPRSGTREVSIRIASGIVMALVAGALLYFGAFPFAFLVASAAVLTSIEWTRIVRGVDFDAGLAVQGAAVAIAAILTAFGLAALGIAAVAAGCILTGLLCFGNRPLLSAEGVLYAGLPVVSLIWLREDQPHGLTAVLFILLAVIATDIAAFIFGRLIGGPKLATAVSPNKTWSGFLGGILTAGLVSAGFSQWIGADPVMLGTSGVILGIVAQLGDLTESALKRSFGIKDSGTIIPGHGGIMDRVDGLVFASAAAGFVAFAVNPQSPATALLFGG
jgi:phosphatidate cytidylyltransferase